MRRLTRKQRVNLCLCSRVLLLTIQCSKTRLSTVGFVVELYYYSDHRGSYEMNHQNQRSGSVPGESITVVSFLRSPNVCIALFFGGAWLLLYTFVHSGFPGSFEFWLAPDDGVHIKIDGVQDGVAEGMQ